ncbi:MAG: hypothetical protein RIS26_357 [Actinomycetota bacterium]|jgi:hypothetical protein
MSEQIPAETTAVTMATVAPGLGYPANRIEESPAPTGWQHSIVGGQFENVSRETSR